jgi:hypothetical protein
VLPNVLYLGTLTFLIVPPDAPKIAESAVIVTQPGAAMFVCTAMARPRPSITWYRVEMNNSRTILTGGEEGVSVSVGNGDSERTRNSTLTFNPSRPFFSAEYICEATNVVASAETNATLTVNGRWKRYRTQIQHSFSSLYSVTCGNKCDELHSQHVRDSYL